MVIYHCHGVDVCTYTTIFLSSIILTVPKDMWWPPGRHDDRVRNSTINGHYLLPDGTNYITKNTNPLNLPEGHPARCLSLTHHALMIVTRHFTSISRGASRWKATSLRRSAMILLLCGIPVEARSLIIGSRIPPSQTPHYQCGFIYRGKSDVRVGHFTHWSLMFWSATNEIFR